MRIAQVLVAGASAVAGFIIGVGAFAKPEHDWSYYPLAPLVLGGLIQRRRAWLMTSIVAVTVFVITFVFGAVTADFWRGPSYGVTPRYSVYPAGEAKSMVLHQGNVDN